MEHGGLYTMSHHKPVRVSDHQRPAWDLSITNFVVFQWLGMLILLLAFISVKNKYRKNPTRAPRGLQNAVEVFVVYIRDNVVRPNVGSDRVTRKLLPYFLSLFFFILVLNVLGLIPGGHSATGAIGVTAGLAITAFFVINITAIREAGVGAWFHHLLGGAPWWLAPIMVPIEVIGLFAKPFALAVRLFANMTAGHIVLVALIGLIFFFQTPFVAAVSTPFSIFIYALETLVVFLQAYIFTMLTAVFVGLGIGDHAHDDHHEEHSVALEHA
jgi:F-type H+-transporting ATPase subunit a